VSLREWAIAADSCSPDVRYEDEVSGCTASAALLTNDKIYVVRFAFYSMASASLIHSAGQRR
jgi:hypothetical protein